MEFVWRYFPSLPHWPQLPRRGAQEGFVVQFLKPLLDTGVLVRQGDRFHFAIDAPEWPECLAAFYELYLAAVEGDEEALGRFAASRESAAGLYAFLEQEPGRFAGAVAVKGQVVGPLTVGFNLTAAGRPAYYDEQLREVIVKTLATSAAWQARTLARTGKPVLLFIDEPGVSIYGQSAYITVTREMIVNDLREMVQAVGAAGGLPGIHACAAVDWSILVESGAGIISYDAYNFFPSLLPYREQLAAFLSAGGILAWGIVPTSDCARDEDGAGLVHRLEEQWEQLAARGVAREMLHRQWLVTPSCGLGLLAEDLAPRIYALCAEVAAALREG